MKTEKRNEKWCFFFPFSWSKNEKLLFFAKIWTKILDLEEEPSTATPASPTPATPTPATPTPASPTPEITSQELRALRLDFFRQLVANNEHQAEPVDHVANDEHQAEPTPLEPVTNDEHQAELEDSDGSDDEYQRKAYGVCYKNKLFRRDFLKLAPFLWNFSIKIEKDLEFKKKTLKLFQCIYFFITNGVYLPS